MSSPIKAAEFILEIGTEEIPARMAQAGMTMISEGFLKAMASREIRVEGLETCMTPRRIALRVPALPLAQEDKVDERRGPAVSAAFGPDGQPTRAAMGFAKSLGLEPSQLEKIDTGKGEYLFARLEVQGKPVAEFLPQVIQETIAGLHFPRSMRWGREKVMFVRPIQWILALFGGEVVDVTYGDVTTGNLTRGHRFHAPETFPVTSFAQYKADLTKARVMVDHAERKSLIRKGLDALNTDGFQVVPDEELLETVTHLVEWPRVQTGGFEAKYLELPKEALITCMRTHQKYFAIEDAEGKLAPRFAFVANTDARDPAVVSHGNERVLKARLDDAMFFFKEDQRKALADYLPDLEGQLFMKGLGTMADKARRISRLAGLIAAECFPGVKETAERAGLLAKADLATQMVFEFPELQGIMGRDYSRLGGEAPAVSRAIFEHYLPRFADDVLPETEAGAALAMADRMDTLAGTFGLGLVPTSSKDPYALRRAALGGLRIMVKFQVKQPITRLLELALDGYGDQFTSKKPEILKALQDFVATRLKVHLGDSHANELVDAVMAPGIDSIPDVVARMEAIEPLRGRPDYEPLVIAFKRVLNITRNQDFGDFSEAALVEPEEKNLWAEFTARKDQVAQACGESDYARALELLTSLKPAVDLYFDKVMVMTEDQALRSNRLAMMAEVGKAFLGIADFTRILV